jgi:hypothetical protein
LKCVTPAIGGLKVGASVAYENTFEVSQLQKHLAVMPAHICFCICLAISHNCNKVRIGNSLKIIFLFINISLDVSMHHPLVTFFLTSFFITMGKCKATEDQPRINHEDIKYV